MDRISSSEAEHRLGLAGNEGTYAMFDDDKPFARQYTNGFSQAGAADAECLGELRFGDEFRAGLHLSGEDLAANGVRNPLDEIFSPGTGRPDFLRQFSEINFRSRRRPVVVARFASK